MRKTSLAVVVLAAVTLVAAACQPAPPPPPPPPHFDVLLVGDSIGFGVGCGVLGHEGDQQDVQCPDRDFSAVNAYAGACSISQGWLQLYNRQATNTGNCYDFPVRWQNHVNAWTPNLVVLVTGGWEIVDRWSSQPCDTGNASQCAPGADLRWGSGTQSQVDAARANYRASLLAALGVLSSQGAQVLVLNSVYMDPPRAAVPGFEVWYEAYTSPLPPMGNAAEHVTHPHASGGYAAWNQPNANTPYNSSEVKIDNFNAALDGIIAEFETDNPGREVEKFNFWEKFSPPLAGDQEFSETACPYPNWGSAVAACPNGAAPITVRDPDGAHFTNAGYAQLACYMLPKVHEMLGIPAPDLSSC